MMFPKTKYLRDKKRLQACRSLPCQHCGAEDGTVVAAHSNEGIHGKGRGIKASDEFVAALCFTCHANLDQGSMSKEDLFWCAVMTAIMYAVLFFDIVTS